MPRRLDKTFADYVTIAISPVLIMMLVGSLVFFLQEVFYTGSHDARVTWILGLFVMAIVLIGRISIEESNERAVLFAIPLAIAVGLAINKFGGGGLLHWGLIAVCWWSAHRLTWDCTVIDEDKDASGQGLLQVVGLDGSGEPEYETPDKEPDEKEYNASFTPVTASWEKEEEKKRKPHVPGVWVVFFSLAALPLFGIGQRFIPASDVASRRYAFTLLLVYVASGLGLLLTTSFLGLRRYLRQRHVEMPPSMAAVWIASGGVLIVVLLVFAALLPRPAAEYAISKVPLRFGTKNLKSSKHALGKDGADQNSPDSKSKTTGDKSQSHDEQADQEQKSSGSSDKRQESDDDRSPSDDSQSGGDSGDEKSKPGESGKPSEDGKGDSGKSSSQGKPQDGKSQDGKSQDGRLQDGKSQNGKSQDGKSQDGKSQDGKSQDGKSQDGKSQQGDQAAKDDRSESNDSDRSDKSDDTSENDPGKDSSEDRSSNREDRPKDKSQEKSEQQQRQEQQAAQDQDSKADSPKSSFSIQKLFSGLMGMLGALLKWLFYLAVLLLALYWLFRSWKTVTAAWAQFLKELRELWQRLFGGKPTPEEETATHAERKPAPRPFADFADPFATGTASRYTPDELVKHTFEAVEAWARENGFPREPEQTPHEFARQLTAAAESLGGNARTLADLYCYVAYAPGRLRAGRTKALAQLWQQLRPTARV